MKKVKTINVTKKFEDKNLGFSRLELKLKGEDIDNIITNSIKRIVQTDIPIFSFSEINITDNTSIFNNNYVKDHVRNIPVWGIENNLEEYYKKEIITEEDFSESRGIIDDDIELTVDNKMDTSALNELNMYVEYKNNSKEIYAVTTDDAEFHYQEGLIKSPYYNPIQLVKLQPGQEIKIDARAKLGTEEISGIFSATNVCFFIQNEKDYDFIIESRGQIKERRILLLALKILNKKLRHFYDNLPKNKGMEGTIIVENEDHTLGNIITKGMQNHSSVQFCGYNTPHPLKKEIHFHYKLNSGNINTVVKEVIIYYETIFNDLIEKIKKV